MLHWGTLRLLTAFTLLARQGGSWNMTRESPAATGRAFKRDVLRETDERVDARMREHAGWQGTQAWPKPWWDIMCWYMRPKATALHMWLMIRAIPSTLPTASQWAKWGYNTVGDVRVAQTDRTRRGIGFQVALGQRRQHQHSCVERQC